MVRCEADEMRTDVNDEHLRELTCRDVTGFTELLEEQQKGLALQGLLYRAHNSNDGNPHTQHLYRCEHQRFTLIRTDSHRENRFHRASALERISTDFKRTAKWCEKVMCATQSPSDSMYNHGIKVKGTVWQLDVYRQCTVHL
jgi:hypothetical protein